MWVTLKELKVPSYPLVQKLGPIPQNVNTAHTLSEHKSPKKENEKNKR